MNEQQRWGALRSELHSKRPDTVQVVRIIQGFEDKSEPVLYAFESLNRRGLHEEAGAVVSQYPGLQASLLNLRKSVEALAKFMGSAMMPAAQEAGRSLDLLARMAQEIERNNARVNHHVNPRIGRRHR